MSRYFSWAFVEEGPRAPVLLNELGERCRHKSADKSAHSANYSPQSVSAVPLQLQVFLQRKTLMPRKVLVAVLSVLANSVERKRKVREAALHFKPLGFPLVLQIDYTPKTYWSEIVGDRVRRFRVSGFPELMARNDRFVGVRDASQSQESARCTALVVCHDSKAPVSYAAGCFRHTDAFFAAQTPTNILAARDRVVKLPHPAR